MIELIALIFTLIVISKISAAFRILRFQRSLVLNQFSHYAVEHERQTMRHLRELFYMADMERKYGK